MQNFNKQTDDQLVAAYAKGNNEAFDALLQRHQSRVYNYIFQMVKDKDLSDDIFQETFVKAITTIRQGRYTETGKFSAWINRIARNLVIDFFRQEKVEASVSSDDDNYDVLNRKELSEETVEDLMIDNQIRADLRRLIKHLPPTQRQVLVMRYYRNLSFKEIAEATGVSINTALGRMRYALLNIRRIANENAIALTR
ncbi:MAG: sigma-70 family RNA polymerase sigma factor [Muribaculaceae bacterium]|nr:sigma-70 family RNA polymerase sigma factor [Muribaculaceae bacterium]